VAAAVAQLPLQVVTTGSDRVRKTAYTPSLLIFPKLRFQLYTCVLREQVPNSVLCVS